MRFDQARFLCFSFVSRLVVLVAMRHSNRPIIAMCIDHIFLVEPHDERAAQISGEAFCEGFPRFDAIALDP